MFLTGGSDAGSLERNTPASGWLTITTAGSCLPSIDSTKRSRLPTTGLRLQKGTGRTGLFACTRNGGGVSSSRWAVLPTRLQPSRADSQLAKRASSSELLTLI